MSISRATCVSIQKKHGPDSPHAIAADALFKLGRGKQGTGPSRVFQGEKNPRVALRKAYDELQHLSAAQEDGVAATLVRQLAARHPVIRGRTNNQDAVLNEFDRMRKNYADELARNQRLNAQRIGRLAEGSGLAGETQARLIGYLSSDSSRDNVEPQDVENTYVSLQHFGLSVATILEFFDEINRKCGKPNGGVSGFLSHFNQLAIQTGNTVQAYEISLRLLQVSSGNDLTVAQSCVAELAAVAKQLYFCHSRLPSMIEACIKSSPPGRVGMGLAVYHEVLQARRKYESITPGFQFEQEGFLNALALPTPAQSIDEMLVKILGALAESAPGIMQIYGAYHDKQSIDALSSWQAIRELNWCYVPPGSSSPAQILTPGVRGGVRALEAWEKFPTRRRSEGKIGKPQYVYLLIPDYMLLDAQLLMSMIAERLLADYPNIAGYKIEDYGSMAFERDPIRVRAEISEP